MSCWKQISASSESLIIACISLCISLFQLEFERSKVRRLEKEQRRITDQLEEERAQHKQLSCALAKECKWASARALEEGHRLTELGRKLDKVLTLWSQLSRFISVKLLQLLTFLCVTQEKEACQALRMELEEERRRALRMEARVEEQLAEFDTEREQLRSRLKKEEAHCCQLRQQVWTPFTSHIIYSYQQIAWHYTPTYLLEFHLFSPHIVIR